jgi:hypothetical protein
LVFKGLQWDGKGSARNAKFRYACYAHRHPQGKHGKCLKEKRKPEKLHSFTSHLEAGQLGSTGKPSHSANKDSLFGNRLLTGL